MGLCGTTSITNGPGTPIALRRAGRHRRDETRETREHATTATTTATERRTLKQGMWRTLLGLCCTHAR
jgi:hypothetical protein